MTLLLQILTLIGSVAMLMYGMKVMSEGLQKMAGGTLSKALGTMTTNRFSGVLTGAFITAAIQSSTATTVMTVSFVSAGILSLAQAISVIMGANIGTTFTAWIMVLGGSGFDMRFVVYSAILIAVVLIYTKKNASMGEFLIGLALMLLGLTTLKINAAEMQLDKMAPVVHFFETTSSWGYGSYFLYLLIGGMLTFAVQSSAAIMAITMTLCSTHVMPIDMGIALVMGENIGTTITSNVVALSASTQARRAAMAHLVFNLFGVFWVLCIFRYFVKMICSLWGVDFTPGVVNNEIGVTELNAILATFHTAFNVCNVIILIAFVPQLEKLVCRIIPTKANAEEDEGKLRFISGGLMSTSEMSIIQAWQEIHLFGDRLVRMWGMVRSLYNEEDETEFNKVFSRIEKYEGITDRMEIEIAEYLNQVADGRLSDQSKHELHKMLRIVSELESVGDANYNMARYMKHRYEGKFDYTLDQNENVEAMFDLCEKSIMHMNASLELNTEGATVTRFHEAANLEHEINNFRNTLKAQNTLNVTEHKYDYLTGVNYMDIILECEKMGDYMINVEEALADCKDR